MQQQPPVDQLEPDVSTSDVIHSYRTRTALAKSMAVPTGTFFATFMATLFESLLSNIARAAAILNELPPPPLDGDFDRERACSAAAKAALLAAPPAADANDASLLPTPFGSGGSGLSARNMVNFFSNCNST